MMEYQMIENLVSNAHRIVGSNHMSYDTTKGLGLYPFGSIVSQVDELTTIIRGCIYSSDEL